MTMDEFDAASRIIHEKVHEDANIIIGLVIDQFVSYGIRLTSSGNFVQGSYIGIDPTGTLTGRGNVTGIYITGSNNQIDGTTAQPRLQTTLLVVFAMLAATLAVVGVYGVVSYAVLQRIPEIGVRLALGATPSQVVRLVVREGTTLLAGGLGIGLLGAALAARALQRFLFEVKGLDPVSWLAASALLGLAAFGASYIPARRAANVSPVTALRR
jgi:ABC-type antimicrobial peptide transport system permease subunit